ncbi:MAG: sugar phosphate isomerase/epimerase [Actinomycetia bacterium]|nr:sugar phosphate isomerase/epimerase [Actinomycetes bacterium]
MTGGDSPFRYCLNTSTVAGQNLDVLAEIELAAEAGYDGIELWIRSLHRYLDQGGGLDRVRRRAEQLGVVIENGIGFADWIVDDPTHRRAGLGEIERDMGMLAELGCRRIAAPPAGATDTTIPNEIVGERFAEVQAIGDRLGVTPQLEMWGASATLGSLADLIDAAAGTGRSDVRLLLDVYHLYRGGSDLHDMRRTDGAAFEIVHLNDIPPNVAPEQLSDADRVFPGDGVAPIEILLRALAEERRSTVLSLELFNRAQWLRPASEVAAHGLETMRACAQRALL